MGWFVIQYIVLVFLQNIFKEVCPQLNMIRFIYRKDMKIWKLEQNTILEIQKL